ncbi:MAG: hypothetical protein HC875_25450 [Anaerolineales bacterium]|nr:hypothetical protein [Anaerolineales bacterium]
MRLPIAVRQILQPTAQLRPNCGPGTRQTWVRRPSASRICQARGVGHCADRRKPPRSRPLNSSQVSASAGKSGPMPPTSPTSLAHSFMPKAVWGPPPPRTVIAVWPSGKTMSSMMRPKATKSMLTLEGWK